MHWDFATVSGSDDSGEFLVEDLSSGSSDNRYGDFSAILEKQHTGQGMFLNQILLIAFQINLYKAQKHNSSKI